MNYSRVDEVIAAYDGKVAPAITVQVRRAGKVVYERAQGWLDPETRQRPVRLDTQFDLASVTKLFVATTFMIQMEQGWHRLDDAVRTQIYEFAGLRPIQAYEHPLQPGQLVQPEATTAEMVDAGKVTYRHLLTHSSGLPAWRPLKDQPDASAALRMALTTNFFYPTGTRTIYSDIGLILLGLAVERTLRWRLDEQVREFVTRPLRLTHTRYLPLAGQPYDSANIAPTEVCAWRGRRVVAEVHDENASRLGGIAGHAGLFSTVGDLARFGQVFLDNGRPLLSGKTVAEMTRLQAAEGSTRRGLGFALWCDARQASGNPFSPSAFGHTGFTGTSLWLDPARRLSVAVLTNRVYYGRDASEILQFRVDLHRAIVDAVDHSQPVR